MGKQEGGRPKGQGGNRFKKQFNNYNPYNKLELNKFHQVNTKHNNYSQQLHKKKRDLERMIQYRKDKGLQVEEEKAKALEQIQQEMGQRRKQFEKGKRKEYFIAAEYQQIMNIEKRKVAKKIRQIKEAEEVDQESLAEWYKKLNYIKHYPKHLKYVALFPNTPLADKAREFQQKIMDDIEADLTKKTQKLNAFEPQYKNEKVSKKKKDDFFLEEIQQEQEQQQQIEQDEAQQ